MVGRKFRPDRPAVSFFGRGLPVHGEGSALMETAPIEEDDWLPRFHAGDRRILERCYRGHAPDARRAVDRVLSSGADQETVVHDVFVRLLSDESARRNFQGGSFAAWISTLARNQAIDFARRYRREVPLVERSGPETTARNDARLLIDQFRTRALPAKWGAVFEARFLRQLSQREAAAELGVSRTTLAYQELRVRALLRKFLKQAGG
jgi:RNA polymerase sigma-70 factor (ECF subfamily)